jgi:hypothetical protein
MPAKGLYHMRCQDGAWAVIRGDPGFRRRVSGPGRDRRRLFAPSLSNSGAENIRRSRISNSSSASSDRGVPTSDGSTGRRARRCSEIRTRTIAWGSCLIGIGEGWQSFVSEPAVPPILQEAGHKGKPKRLLSAEPTTRSSASRTLEGCRQKSVAVPAK